MKDEIITSNISFEPEYIKLTKNSKGYNWEIKLSEINIDKLKELNKEMKVIFLDEI